MMGSPAAMLMLNHQVRKNFTEVICFRTSGAKDGGTRAAGAVPTTRHV